MSAGTNSGQRTPGTIGTLGDDHELSEKSREYGENVVTGDEWPIDDIDLEKITWETSTRAKRRHGVCTFHSNSETTIRISEHTYENAGFTACKETIRHELVHCWQYQHSGETQTVRGTTVECETGHQESFRVWVAPLQLNGRCSTHYSMEADDYTYVYECPSCSYWVGKHRLCKSVRQAASGGEGRYGYRYCKSCSVKMHLRRGNRFLEHGRYTDDEIKRFVDGDDEILHSHGVVVTEINSRPVDG